MMKKLIVCLMVLSVAFNSFSGDIKISSVDFPGKINVGNHWVEGSVLNESDNTVTSMTINWTIDEGIARTLKLTDLNILPGEGYKWTHSYGWAADEEGTFNLKAWLSEVNGAQSTVGELQKSIEVFKAQKLALIEIITSANCNPCAATVPGLQERVRASKTYGISIEWHGGPGAYSGDDMYQDNKDMYNRMSYYNGNSYPTATINGDINTYDYPTQINESLILSKSQEITQFNIEDLTLKIDDDMANFSARIIAPEGPAAYTGAYRVLAVLMEKEVKFSSPPGTNGQTSFVNVAKAAYPHIGGTDIRDIIDSEGGGTLEGSFDLTSINVYDPDELAIIMFIQNGGTNQVDQKKEVYQAAFADLRGEPDVTVPEEPTNISSINFHNSFKVFPNPVSHNLNITIEMERPEALALAFIDLIGKEIKYVEVNDLQSGSNDLSINTSDIADGVYLLELRARDASFTKKIIIRR